MTFFAFNDPQPNQPSPGSITLYLNAGEAATVSMCQLLLRSQLQLCWQQQLCWLPTTI
jgi:hypothetical protein